MEFNQYFIQIKKNIIERTVHTVSVVCSVFIRIRIAFLNRGQIRSKMGIRAGVPVTYENWLPSCLVVVVEQKPKSWAQVVNSGLTYPGCEVSCTTNKWVRLLSLVWRKINSQIIWITDHQGCGSAFISPPEFWLLIRIQGGKIKNTVTTEKMEKHGSVIR